MNEKILKLYALAQRGVGGEKVNAEKILARMLRDANLTIADLEREEHPAIRRQLKYGRGADFQKLMFQIIFCVLNTPELDYYKTRKRGIIEIELTDLQYAEVILRWNIYSAALKKEKEYLLRAFFTKHKIYSKKPGAQKSNLTDREEMEIWKKMASMDDIVIPRQLSGRLLEAK